MEEDLTYDIDVDADSVIEDMVPNADNIIELDYTYLDDEENEMDHSELEDDSFYDAEDDLGDEDHKEDSDEYDDTDI